MFESVSFAQSSLKWSREAPRGHKIYTYSFPTVYRLVLLMLRRLTCFCGDRNSSTYMWPSELQKMLRHQEKHREWNTK